MRQNTASFVCLFLVCGAVLFPSAQAARGQVGPFFNVQEEGLATVDAEGEVAFRDHVRNLKEQDFRRRLAVGFPNLGGAFNGGGGGSSTTDDLGGEASGNGGGKGFMGKGGKGKPVKKGKGKGKGGKGDSSSGSKGKGKGDGSSSGGGGGGRPMPDFGDDWIIEEDDDTMGGGGGEPGQPGIGPCMCNPSFCDCEEGQLATDYEFVLVRDEIGSDTPADAEFGVASGIGLNGHVYNMVYTTTGRGFGGDPIGIFKGICTVVSDLNGELLCTYEIFLYANGEIGIGGVIVTGPVAGLETGKTFESVVTGAEFDFAPFNTGFLTTVQDPQKPILYSFLSLYL